MALTDLNKHAETVEQLINGLAEAFREKRWVKLLSFIGVVFALLLNPPAIEYGSQLFGFNKPQWYSYRIWGIVVASFFVSAFLIALLTRKRQEPETTTTAVSIIKGLLPYTNTKEDAEWFARLQRGSILRECMGFCLGADSSFGILSGESGAGKTSFLQAALCPSLERQGHRPVYVKLTDEPPLNTIRQSLHIPAEETTSNGDQSLLELLRQVTRNDARPVVLILDQFEQFFAHNKTKLSRKAFIQQMAEWYTQGGSLPVKVLISIRGDFANRMNEFQNEMKYTLTLHSNLYIEKFEPQEAGNVIGVIAKEANIKSDESFIKKFTEQELAHREDGTVSPVDVQLLCWMIARQKRIEERAFNQKAFQRLGGVEGLLERFLKGELKALEPDTKLQEAAIKVMLALTDGNVRTGALSLKSLKEKLKEKVSERDIEKAVSWLVRADVRLVTPTQEKNVTLYELAHERIIPSVRRLAFKELKGVREAQETLDRRLNEWLGNNRSRRYLLTFNEWRLINHHRTIITSGSQEEFVAFSRRHFLTIGLGSAALLIIGVGGYGGYRWYEQRLDVQMQRTQERLLELLENNNDARAIQEAAILLIALGNNRQDRELSEKLWEAVNKLETGLQAEVLQILAEAYSKVENTPATLDALTKVRQKIEALDVDDQAHVLLSLAGAYSKIGNIREVLDGLTKVRQAVVGLEITLQAHILQLVAGAYGRLGNSGEVLDGLAGVRREAEQLDTYSRSIVLVSLAEAYGKFGDIRVVLDDLTEVRQAIANLETNIQSSILGLSAQAYSKLGNTGEVLEGLAEVRRQTEKLGAYYRCFVLVDLAEAYGKFGNTHVVLDDLAKVKQEIKSMDRTNQASVLPALAEAYSRLGNTSAVLEGLAEVRRQTEMLDRASQLSIFQPLTLAYSKLGNMPEVLDGLGEVHQAAKKLYPQDQAQVLSYVADAYSKLEHNRRVVDGLVAVVQTTENLDPNIQVYVLHLLSKIYGKSGNIDEELRTLARILRMEKDLSPYIKTLVLVDVASRYAKLEKWKESLDVTRLISGVNAVYALSRILLIWRDTKNHTKYMDVVEEVFQNAPTREP
jgi:tetratricopeptide (TPR) repeat protein